MGVKAVIAMDKEQNICREIIKKFVIYAFGDAFGDDFDDDEVFNSFYEQCLNELGKYFDAQKVLETYFAYVLFLYSLCKNNLLVFDDVVSFLDKNGIMKAFPRLKLVEIYETLKTIKTENAEKLLERISPDDSTYTNLCEYLENDDKEHFIECLGKCSTQDIANHLKFFHFPIRFKEKIIEFIDNYGDEVDDDVILNKLKAFFNPILVESEKSESRALVFGACGVRMGVNFGAPRNDSLFWMFQILVLEHKELIEKNLLDNDEMTLSKSILCHVGEDKFEEVYRCKEEDIDFSSFEKLYLPYLKEHHPELLDEETEDVEVEVIDPIKEQEDKPQMVVPQNKPQTPSTRGRKRATWFKPHPDITEEEFSKGIERDIWPKLKKRLDGFKFADKCNSGIAREKVVKVLGASLIYYAAEKAGIAYPFDRNSSKNKSVGSMSSFERTMAFLKTKDGTGLSRTSMKPYMEMFDQYERGLQFITQGNSFFDFLNRYMKHDGIRATILAHNIKSFSGILKELDSKLTTIYNKPLEL